ncbi:unnamed protein product [Nesidiocoris tenuis]|uniref:Uncharacterized protein n=1 Tax=Nesidiocoris tenuis TaxID=355587 RepID=A0A6H5HPI6_9HEMI|nr:unnamed protein product [Nesidiocoris tenuis]
MDQTQTHPETLLSTDEQVIAVPSETSHERLNAQPPTCGTQPAGGSDLRHSAGQRVRREALSSPGGPERAALGQSETRSPQLTRPPTVQAGAPRSIRLSNLRADRGRPGVLRVEPFV